MAKENVKKAKESDVDRWTSDGHGVKLSNIDPKKQAEMRKRFAEAEAKMKKKKG